MLVHKDDKCQHKFGIELFYANTDKRENYLHFHTTLTNFLDYIYKMANFKWFRNKFKNRKYQKYKVSQNNRFL